MIKNENELLGLLIDLQDENKNIDNNKLISSADIDSHSLQYLMNGLIEKHYVSYSLDTTSLTDLGIMNYISPKKRFLTWLSKALVITAKEVVIFLSGTASGVLISYFVWKFGWF